MNCSTALTLIACLNFGLPQQSSDVWDSVHGLPPGTRLRLTFNDGSEVTGTVVETRPDAVVMNDNQPGRAGITLPRGSSLRDALTFGRSEVATAFVLKVPTRYSANGAPDVAALRHVVAALGIGRKIDLTRLGDWEHRRVTIQSIEPDGFSYVHGFRAAPVSIAYRDVGQVKAAGLHGAIKFAIIYLGGGIVLTVIGAMAMAAAS